MAKAPVRVVSDEITPALQKLISAVRGNQRMITVVASDARTTIQTRTLAGTSLSGSAFTSYKSAGTYYAPIKSRTPGYPSPKGGRRKALRGGRTLKTAAFDRGYGDY